MTSKQTTEHSPLLAGLRVLVMEDDYFIADEICSVLSSHGAEILGPCPDLDQGLRLMQSERIDCAILDINLRGHLAFHLADELRRQGTPSIFATGYDDSVLPEHLSGSIRLEKPINLSALLRAVQVLCPRTTMHALPAS